MYLLFNIVHSEGNVKNSDIQSPYVEKDETCIQLQIDFVFCFNLLLDSSENNSSQYLNKCSRVLYIINGITKFFHRRTDQKGAQGEYRYSSQLLSARS
jgi:hypothetical protein